MASEREPMRGSASEPVSVTPGIDAREAAREAELERWAWRRMRALRSFYTHLLVYVAVNFGLLVADFALPGGPWFFYPLLGWGLALALHGVQVYGLLPWFTRSWEQRKVQELIEEARRR